MNFTPFIIHFNLTPSQQAHDVVTTSFVVSTSGACRVEARLIYANEPRHEISNNVVCTTSKVSDQPAHTRSLIRTFAS